MSRIAREERGWVMVVAMANAALDQMYLLWSAPSVSETTARTSRSTRSCFLPRAPISKPASFPAPSDAANPPVRSAAPLETPNGQRLRNRSTKPRAWRRMRVRSRSGREARGPAPGLVAHQGADTRRRRGRRAGGVAVAGGVAGRTGARVPGLGRRVRRGARLLGLLPCLGRRAGGAGQAAAAGDSCPHRPGAPRLRPGRAANRPDGVARGFILR